MEVKPFLGFATAPDTSAKRTFAAALETVDVPTRPSPWSPKPSTASTAPAPAAPAPASAAPPTPPIDVDAIRAEAAARGREEGLAETDALKTRLTALATGLAARQAEHVHKLADLVADAACTVIAAWSKADRRTQLATVIEAWCAETVGPATVRVHPDDVALIDAPDLKLEADPALAPGDLVLRNAGAELVHVWAERMDELHKTIAAALEEQA